MIRSQARVKEINDLAYYVHCCAHRLNLALAASCDHVTEAVSFFGLIEKLYVFITGSQPRFVIFQEVQKELNLTKRLQKLCETRWYCKNAAVTAIKHNYPALLLVLERIKQLDRSPSVVTECQGLLSQIGRLDFILMLEIWEDLLDSTFALSEYLQKDIFDVTH